MQKITKETYLDWYENMFFWRKFEDKLAAVYIQQKVRGFLHLYNGQEAVLAGALHAMDLSKDKMIRHTETMYNPLVWALTRVVSWQNCMAKQLEHLKD